MYKQYKHKLNMLHPGGTFLKLIGVCLLGGVIAHLNKWEIIRNILVGIAFMLVTLLLALVIIELHQDKVLNEQAIYLDSKLEAGIHKKSFALNYNGGMIWCEHLDSLGDSSHIVVDKFEKDMQQLIKKSTPAYVAVNLDETLVNREILEKIVYSYRDMDKDLKKVAFIGLSRRNKKLLHKIVKGSQKPITYIVTCIDDYEKAKEWLV